MFADEAPAPVYETRLDGLDIDEIIARLGSPAPPARTTSDGISLARILRDRPDVLQAYHASLDGPLNDPRSKAWDQRVGGRGPEDYANYWYETHGRAEGYAPASSGAPPEDGAAEAPGPVDAAAILRLRPDVLEAYYRGYFGAGADRHSNAWAQRVGGETPEAYALYWWRSHGQYEPSAASGAPAADPEGYAALVDAACTGRTTADGISLAQILKDRPDVYRAFFTEYYGPNNDRHSSAWVDRVGGTTVEDYADYWYKSYGRWGGYLPRSGSEATGDPDPDYRVEDPSLDPWNHPALFPDAERPPELDDPAGVDDPYFWSDPEAPMFRILPGQALLGAEDPLGG